MASSRQEIKAELAWALAARYRQQCTGNLISFCKYTNPRYIADPIHYLIADHLEAVLRGDIRRLIITTPPQVGKSTLVSVNFPAYWLGHDADTPVLLCSYGQELADLHSRNSRTIIESDEYQQLFPHTRTRQDSRAANRWHILRRGGGMRAAGVGGGIAGHPVSLGIIDDPVRGSDWAFSTTQLEKLWAWYTNDFLQRLSEDAPIIITQTRWAEGDLAGRILRSPEASEWTLLRIPALSETQAERDDNNRRLGLPTGLPDPLNRGPEVTCCPSRYSTDYYLKLRDSGLEWRFSALYQGVPHPEEGTEIKRSWFDIVPDYPRDLVAKVRYWDKAGSEGSGARTAGALLVIDRMGIVYIVDVVAGQWGIAERNSIMRQTAALDAARFVIRDPAHPEALPDTLPGYNSVFIHVETEPGSGGKESAEATILDLGGFPAYGDRVSGKGSKETRAAPFISYASARNVKLVRGEWNALWLDEAAAWPYGRFKDQIDATSGAFNKLRSGRLSLGIAGVE